MRRLLAVLCTLLSLCLALPAASFAQQIKPGEEMPVAPIEKPAKAAKSSKSAKSAKSTKKKATGKPSAKVKAVKKDPEAYATTGTIRLSMAQGAFIVSASGGEGVLTYRRGQHPFRIGGGGLGGFGFARSEAVGTVENLKSIEDFPGLYGQARAGFAVGQGKGMLVLENTNGVIIKLKATTKGLALTLGGDGLVIEMGATKQ